jgi:phage-related protein
MTISIQIRYFTAPNGTIPVAEFLKGLSIKDRLKMERCIELLKMMGLSLQMPHCRSITGHPGLYELRSQTGGNTQRVFYFTITEAQNSVAEAVLLHGFTKKTDKTPRKEIEQAEKNRAVYLKQQGESE